MIEKTYIGVASGYRIIGTAKELAKFFCISKNTFYIKVRNDIPIRYNGRLYYFDELFEGD